MLSQSNVSLRALNSFGVEARARRVLVVENNDDLTCAIDALAGERHPLILGGGSNILFVGDFDGAILRMGLRGRRVLGAWADSAGETEATTLGRSEAQAGQAQSEVIVEAQAGESWHAFVQWTLGLGLYGLENLSLIPGTVGAAPMQNIGAYGVELRDCFESLSAIDLDTGAERRFRLADCGFGYRDSRFKRPGSRWLIRAVRFRLSRLPRVRLAYADLRERLDPASARPEDVAREVIAIRRHKLPDPAVLGNAGSFFRNPELPAEMVAALQTQHQGLPVYPTDRPGFQKLAAGWLIDQCGWKGVRRGDAGVHERHALVLVNYGQATGLEILALAQAIQRSVFERFGIMLEPEPRIVAVDDTATAMSTISAHFRSGSPFSRM